MEEQTQNSVNLEIPSRWKRFSAYLLDLIINISVVWIIPWGMITFDAGNIVCVITMITILVLIFVYLIFIISKKTTIWNNETWIIALNKDNNPMNWWQATLRFFVFNPAFLALILLEIWLLISLVIYIIGWYNTVYDIEGPIIQNQDSTWAKIRTIQNFANWSGFFGFILFLISVIEIFFKCPTFIDKLLWIKRFYKKYK